jgi:hypothetical protein
MSAHNGTGKPRVEDIPIQRFEAQEDADETESVFGLCLRWNRRDSLAILREAALRLRVPLLAALCSTFINSCNDAVAASRSVPSMASKACLAALRTRVLMARLRAWRWRL